MSAIVRLLLPMGALALFIFGGVDALYTCDPRGFAGRVMSDKWGGYRGECVSFVKVIYHNNL